MKLFLKKVIDLFGILLITGFFAFLSLVVFCAFSITALLTFGIFSADWINNIISHPFEVRITLFIAFFLTWFFYFVIYTKYPGLLRKL